MRSVFAIVLVAMFSFAAQAEQKKANPSCLQKCEKAKNACMAQYTKSDRTSGKFVTPEGAKTCWEGFHSCKKECPKK